MSTNTNKAKPKAKRKSTAKTKTNTKPRRSSKPKAKTKSRRASSSTMDLPYESEESGAFMTVDVTYARLALLLLAVNVAFTGYTLYKLISFF